MTDDFGVGAGGRRAGGSDYGSDIDRDLGDEPAPAYRDAPPDILGAIDASAPVSGHVPLVDPDVAASLAPEHDWSAAAAVIVPLLRRSGRSACGRPRSTGRPSSRPPARRTPCRSSGRVRAAWPSPTRSRRPAST